jgi:predicted secreted protein
MSDAIAALGVVLQRDGNPVAELTSIGGVSLSRETIEATNFDSEDGYEEIIAGIRSGGEVPIEGNFIAGDTSGQAGLKADYDSDTLQDYAIVFPTTITASWAFTGLVTKFETGFEVKGKVAFSASIKISGKPVLSIGASAGLTNPFFAISESAVITPDPAGNVYDYVATVLTGVASVTLTPTAAAGVIKVNGNTVVSGQASSAIALGAAGSVTTVTVTVQETGKVKKTYTIRIARAAA